MARAIKYVGTILALIFIGIVLVRSATDMPDIDYTSGIFWVGLSGGFALYLASQFIGALAWHATLRIYDVEIPCVRAGSQLLVSQVGKYIPGNVAHLFGRFALARADGVSAAPIGAAMLLEVGILLTVGVLIVSLLLLVLPEFVSALTAGLPETKASISGLGIFLLLICAIALGQVVIWRKAGKPRLRLSAFIAPSALHFLNFILLGISLWCIANAVSPGNAPGLLHATAIFTTAWVAGFLMPGAPGGVGVRDGIIALGLELFTSPGAGLAIAILHRVVSVLGDVAAFGSGVAMRRTQSVSETG